MITETEPVNSLAALMAIFAAEDGGWMLIERDGELYLEREEALVTN